MSDKRDYKNGKRDATLESLSNELEDIHCKLDTVIDNHGNRLTAIETTGRVFKYIISLIGLTSIIAFFKSMSGG